MVKFIHFIITYHRIRVIHSITAIAFLTVESTPSITYLRDHIITPLDGSSHNVSRCPALLNPITEFSPTP